MVANVRTVWYFWKYSDSVVFFGNVRTMWQLLEMFGQCGIFWKCSDSVVFFGNMKIPHCPNISKKYHTVRIFPENTTLSEHFQNIPHCPNISRICKSYLSVERKATNSQSINQLINLNVWFFSSPPVFSGIRVTRSLVLCVCIVDRLSFCHSVREQVE
jgi:hypothetical protein